MAVSRVTVRRRRLSVRVTGALVLLSVATVCVLASLPARAPTWHSLAALTALALFAGAMRLMCAEVVHSRRVNAADRAASATTYRSLFSASTVEHTEFATAMTERLAEAHMTQRELEGLVTQLESRSQGLHQQLTEAHTRERRLEETLALASTQAATVSALATWEGQSVQKISEKKSKGIPLRSALKPA